MKILYLSDLHTEMPEHIHIPPFPTDMDIIVFAGDLGHKKSIYLWLEMLHYASKCAKHVIVILGNHEHYDFDFETAVTFYRDQIKKFGLTNVHLLEQESITIGRDYMIKISTDLRSDDGITFLGCTLWVNATRKARNRPDYERKNSKLTPELVADRHIKSIEWLRGELAKPQIGPIVVVTHHVPIKPDDFNGHGGLTGHTSHWTDMGEFISEHQPDIWIYGHDHNPNTTVIGKTIIVTSPVGYIDEELQYTHRIIEI